MASEVVTKGSKRLRLSTEHSEESVKIEAENSEKTDSSGTTSQTQDPGRKGKPEMSKDAQDDDIVVISSDDDSEKDAGKKELAGEEPMDVTKEDTDKEQSTEKDSKAIDEKPMEMKSNVADDKVAKKDEELTSAKQETKSEKDNANEKPVSDSKLADSDSDDCISQEDLLAQLGLSSVRAMTKKDSPRARKEEKLSNGIPAERKPLIPHRPKESIVDLLRAPKLKIHEDHKKKVNGDAAVSFTNGVIDEDDSMPGSPEDLDDDDELMAKEQLIEELRQELRNEEAKLLLLKKLQEAQNDTSKSSTMYQKEKENEKLLSAVQYSSGSMMGTNQVTSKKGQLLPPPPPLKTHVTTAGTYQPPVAIQPKLLPKVGNVQSLHPSSPILSSANPVISVQSIKGTSSSGRTGSSAIKDLQNVISSMSTNLIHPTPLYLRTGSQGSAVYTAPSQPSPVRPTPVRANTTPGAVPSGGYTTFQSHVSSGSSKVQSHSQGISSAGKQAAAKMALRKQLEKTLLQIPPPKPPPPEWSFIPSLNSTEFMTLVGFEKVVDSIAKKEGKVVPLTVKQDQENPKVCDQCGTDFTPGWRAKPNNSTGVLLCEKCSTVNVKKELKTEHTSRLKAAFLKALKQEQEIEQKINETTPIAPKPHSQKAASHQSSSSSSGRQHHHLPHHQGILHHHHQRVQPGIYHHHQQQQHTDSLLFQLQQQHLQQQQQEMEVACRQADVRWHPYLSQHHHSSHKPQHHHNYVSDSDRQYLLDMIPSLPAQPLGYGSSRI